MPPKTKSLAHLGGRYFVNRVIMSPMHHADVVSAHGRKTSITLNTYLLGTTIANRAGDKNFHFPQSPPVMLFFHIVIFYKAICLQPYYLQPHSHSDFFSLSYHHSVSRKIHTDVCVYRESVCLYVNSISSPPSAAYMRQWIESALIQIMTCRLFGA